MKFIFETWILFSSSLLCHIWDMNFFFLFYIDSQMRYDFLLPPYVGLSKTNWRSSKQVQTCLVFLTWISSCFDKSGQDHSLDNFTILCPKSFYFHAIKFIFATWNSFLPFSKNSYMRYEYLFLDYFDPFWHLCSYMTSSDIFSFIWHELAGSFNARLISCNRFHNI